MSHYSLPSYTYVIEARGKILDSKTIIPVYDDSVGSEYKHRFTFTPNFNYAPKAQIIVYCVRDRMIVWRQVSVDLYDDFNNFIDIDMSKDVAKPGDIVDINVKSNSNSYIGLLGIDQSVLILRDGNDLARTDILSELGMFHCRVKDKSYDEYERRFNDWHDFSVNKAT